MMLRLTGSGGVGREKPGIGKEADETHFPTFLERCLRGG